MKLQRPIITNNTPFGLRQTVNPAKSRTIGKDVSCELLDVSKQPLLRSFGCTLCLRLLYTFPRTYLGLLRTMSTVKAHDALFM